MANRRSIEFRVTGTSQLTELRRALSREADGKQRVRQLNKELKDAAKPIVPLVRANIMALPSKNQSRILGHKPLRKRLSRAVTVQVRYGSRAGVFVFMNPRKMPDGEKALPAYFERKTGQPLLRHPVFGNRQAWVTQLTPQEGYFTRSLGGIEQRVTRKIEQIIDDTKRRVESG